MIPSTAIITQGLQRKLGTPQFYMLLVFFRSDQKHTFVVNFRFLESCFVRCISQSVKLSRSYSISHLLSSRSYQQCTRTTIHSV